MQHKAGLATAAVFDLRQQCAGFLFGLDLADMLIATGRAGTVVLVGAEVHAGYLPWGDAWDIVLGRSDRPPTGGRASPGHRAPGLECALRRRRRRRGPAGRVGRACAHLLAGA